MTKRQVRARMRRMREQFEEAEDEHGEINLVPYMDIVTNIIIFLLASVVNQVPLGTVNVSSPTFGAGGGGDSAQEKPALNLTVTVGGTGFTLAGSGGVMPPIPKLPTGDYDYLALTTKLTEIKKAFSDATKATFNADEITAKKTCPPTSSSRRAFCEGSRRPQATPGDRRPPGGEEGHSQLCAQARRPRGHQGSEHHPDDGHDDHHPGLLAQELHLFRDPGESGQQPEPAAFANAARAQASRPGHHHQARGFGRR